MNGLVRGRRGLLATRSLELNVTTHCNLKCYGCGRGSPAFDEEYVALRNLAGDLSALSRVLHTREFKLAGGEPLQHPAILDIADIVRRSGIADRITLITNGVLLGQAPAALWNKIDHMWVSVYPGVERSLNEADIMAMGQRHGVTIRYKVTDSFDRRMLNARNTDSTLVQQIYSSCYQTRGCHSIYNGRYFKCASGPLIPKWLETAGCDAPDFDGDGVPIRDNPKLREALEAYLTRETPLEACSYCLGGMGKTAPHHQLNAEGVRAWLAEDHTDVDQLVDLSRLDSPDNPEVERTSLLTRVTSGVREVFTSRPGE